MHYLVGIVTEAFLEDPKIGGKGIRTPGLLIANETLYQLSYTPKSLVISYTNKFVRNFQCQRDYYAQKKINGKRKEHRLGTTDRKIAERRLKEWIANLNKCILKQKK